MVLSLVLAVLLQSVGGAYEADFSDYDEAAHYVTGLMIREYILHFPSSEPIEFARTYYNSYPKVAIGHWPPVFYFAQAIWTIPFSAGRTSLLVFMALLAASCTVILYRIASVEFGHVSAAVLGVLFVALPVVQILTHTVMAELLVTFFCLLATVSFARFLRTQTTRDALLFAAFATLAIMTKANGWALALLPPLAVAAGRRWRIMLRPAFWIPAPIVAAACIPWYFFTFDLAREGWRGSTSPKFLFVTVVNANSKALFGALGAAICVLAVCGLYAHLVKPLVSRRDPGPVWAAMAGLLGCVLIFHNFITPVREIRHFLPAIPAILMFAAAGVEWLAIRLSFLPGDESARTALVGAAAISLFFVQTFSFRSKADYGAHPIAQAISSAHYAGANILVSSSDKGEGAVIAEAAMMEPSPKRKILRATKLLAAVAWDGHSYRLTHASPRAVIDMMERTQVQVVVLDTRPSPNGKYAPHHIQLKETIRSFPDHFRQISSDIAHSPSFEVLEFQPGAKS